ncbi:glutamate--tRNA ligase [Candidatus Peregrinibacteria bacterium CG_4_10_14_0_2_um_filter_38_24]|nr:MAG: glutamate--tRNA ligase [Candidatus Peregrinibacteria bacterium CG_4_10_14_0_2_um_filter_38_24]PJC38551.1 MAG: glutamate--tRNA ligase [Candidatus Peregrinibacteria bacterium CG_4_9_14_0_2_um_filter_38_9]
MVRTRFAPSPTGYLHVGGLRTALYCYLFAKKNKGNFLLRIEDTDQERFVEGAVENLIKTLSWIRLDHDEGPLLDGSEKGEFGPYTQSKRTEIYKKHADELIEKGHAYRCFCTKERLEEMHNAQEKNKLPPMYDRTCAKLPQSKIEEKLASNTPFVIRQKMPYELIKFKDLVRGNVQFDGKIIDDQVLIKSDGFPTYHLANVVDDHSMQITHVIRGEEWLPSTPKHIALYKAFGWEHPEFAHLPLLLNSDKSKLSKRQGDVSVESYIEKGYLKEAIINFAAFLGWNPGSGEEKEIFTLEELEEVFSIEHIHKAGAIFNIEKLDWFNWRWQKEIFNKKIFPLAKEIDEKVEIDLSRKDQPKFAFTSSDKEEKFIEEKGKILLEICKKYLDKKYLSDKNISKMLVTVEEKILRDAKEVSSQIDFYFTLPNYSKELLTNEKMGVDFSWAKKSIEEAQKNLEKLDNWNIPEIKDVLTKIVERLECKNGQVFWPLRAALSGLDFSPGVFEIMYTLGKEKSLQRIKKALEKL